VADLDKGQEFISRTQKLFGSRNEGNSALNKTMSSFATSQAKIFKSLDSSIQNLNKNLEGMTKATDKKKSFVKREDPSTKLYKAVDDLESLMRENNKLQQQDKKKKGGFWSDLAKHLKLIGPALAGAGLVAFLLTGDPKFLKGIVKGTARLSTRIYGAIFKGVEGAITGTKKLWTKMGGYADEFLMQPLKKGWTKAAGWADTILMQPLKKGWTKAAGYADEFFPAIGKGFSKAKGAVADFALSAKGSFDNVLKGMSGSFDNIMKSLGGATDNILKSVGGVASDVVAKLAKTGAGKAAAKVGKVGAKVGGFLGKAGGKVGKVGAKVGGFLGKAGGKVGKVGGKVLGKGGLAGAKGVIGVGSLVNTVFAIDKAMKGDWKGAAMEMAAAGLDIASVMVAASTAAATATGVGAVAAPFGISAAAALQGASTAMEVATTLRDVGREFYDKEGVAKEREKGGLFKAIGGIGKKGDTIKLKNGKAPTKPKSMGMFSGLKRLAGKTKAKLGWKTGKGGVAGSIAGLQLADDGVNFEGMDNDIKHNFLGMVGEWLSLPKNAKRNVQINSAYRSLEDQARLYKEDPSRAAPPGSSMHNFRRAMDINSREADDMANSGLMKKWGFEQPGVVNKWTKKNGEPNYEPWHIEPIGQNRELVKAGLAVPMDTPSAKTQVGDTIKVKPMPGMNLPSKAIGSNVGSSVSNKLDLSEATIQALASAMGASFSRALPKGNSSRAPSANVQMRG